MVNRLSIITTMACHNRSTSGGWHQNLIISYPFVYELCHTFMISVETHHTLLPVKTGPLPWKSLKNVSSLIIWSNFFPTSWTRHKPTTPIYSNMCHPNWNPSLPLLPRRWRKRMLVRLPLSSPNVVVSLLLSCFFLFNCLVNFECKIKEIL